MSFLERVFSDAMEGDVPEYKGSVQQSDFVPNPMISSKSSYSPFSRSLNSRTRPGSSRRKFPIQHQKSVAVIDTALKGGERLGQGYRVIKSIGPTSFVVQKHNKGRHFFVKVGVRRSCTCPECEMNDATKKGGVLDSTKNAVTSIGKTAQRVSGESAPKICGAMLFVLLKVLRVPTESPLLWKQSWSDANSCMQQRGQRVRKAPYTYRALLFK